MTHILALYRQSGSDRALKNSRLTSGNIPAISVTGHLSSVLVALAPAINGWPLLAGPASTFSRTFEENYAPRSPGRCGGFNPQEERHLGYLKPAELHVRRTRSRADPTAAKAGLDLSEVKVRQREKRAVEVAAAEGPPLQARNSLAHLM